MNITFKQKVRNASPRIFRLIYTRLKEYFGRANLAAPVVQMYINDEQMSSVAGFNNFLSFLLAEIKTCGYLEVVL
jgi:hypothetical protein